MCFDRNFKMFEEWNKKMNIWITQLYSLNIDLIDSLCFHQNIILPLTLFFIIIQNITTKKYINIIFYLIREYWNIYLIFLTYFWLFIFWSITIKNNTVLWICHQAYIMYCQNLSQFSREIKGLVFRRA